MCVCVCDEFLFEFVFGGREERRGGEEGRENIRVAFVFHSSSISPPKERPVTGVSTASIIPAPPRQGGNKLRAKT